MDPAALPTALIALAGVALLTAAFADATMTTTAVAEPAGPLTRFLAQTVWRGFRLLTSRSESRLLRASGSLVALTVVGSWVLSLWVGWTLIYSSVPGSVILDATNQPASFASKFYFSATTMVTTGLGDFVPASDPWRVLAGVTSVSGLALVTLALGYLIPVIQAGVDRMHTAQRLSQLGRSPQAILFRHWDGAGFDLLLHRLPAAADGVIRLRTEVLAFPVLHFFHGADPERAIAPRVAALDEALSMLTYGVSPEHRPNERALTPAREAVDSLLETVVNQAFARPQSDAPPAPSLAELRESGIPTVSDEEFAARMGQLRDRRRKLLSYVRDDSWNWSEVYQSRSR